MYPFSAEEDRRYIKYLFFDTGVMQTLLGMAASEVLTSTEVDLVNKGGMSEMFAGLELYKISGLSYKAGYVLLAKLQQDALSNV